MPKSSLSTPGITVPDAGAQDSFARYVGGAFPGGKFIEPHVAEGPFHAVAVFTRSDDTVPVHSWEVLMAYPRVRMRAYDWEDDLAFAVVALVPNFAYEVLASDSNKEGGDFWIGLEPTTFGAKEPNPQDVFQHLHMMWNLPHGDCEGLGDDPDMVDVNACELSDCDPPLAAALEKLTTCTDLEVFLDWAHRHDCWSNDQDDARRELILAYAAAFA